MKFKRLIATVLACCVIFSIIPSFVSAQGPTLKEGNYAAWIDRLGDMPQYAFDFYEWLADNSVEGGALRTAKGESNFSDGMSAHLVAEIPGTTNSFNFPIGASDSTIQTNAINACAENIRKFFGFPVTVQLLIQPVTVGQYHEVQVTARLNVQLKFTIYLNLLL